MFAAGFLWKRRKIIFQFENLRKKSIDHTAELLKKLEIIR